LSYPASLLSFPVTAGLVKETQYVRYSLTLAYTHLPGTDEDSGDVIMVGNQYSIPYINVLKIPEYAYDHCCHSTAPQFFFVAWTSLFLGTAVPLFHAYCLVSVALSDLKISITLLLGILSFHFRLI
jgi:hypothetical protein